MVRQLKGKKHIRYIKRKAMRLWKGVNFEQGLRNDCLQEILKRHRESVAADLERSKRKIAEMIEEKPSETQREFSYPACLCDNNGWVG